MENQSSITTFSKFAIIFIFIFLLLFVVISVFQFKNIKHAKPAITPTPTPSATPTVANGQKPCQTNSDCNEDEICTQGGPIMINPETKQIINKKTCWKKGSPIPL